MNTLASAFLIIWDVTVNKLKALERVCEKISNKVNPESEEN